MNGNLSQSALAQQKKFNDLVDQLTTNLRPVKRLTSSARSVVVLIAASIFAVAAVLVCAFGVREALPETHDFPTYLMNEGGCLAAAILMAFAASRARVPGESPSTPLKLAGFLLGLTTLGLVAFAISSHQTNAWASAEAGWSCTERALLLAIPSALLGVAFVRRGAPVSKWRAGLAVAGIAVGLSALVLPFVCENGAGLHLLISHLLLPLALVAAAVVAGSRWIFRW